VDSRPFVDEVGAAPPSGVGQCLRTRVRPTTMSGRGPGWFCSGAAVVAYRTGVRAGRLLPYAASGDVSSSAL
jgi:hypothetical protein